MIPRRWDTLPEPIMRACLPDDYSFDEERKAFDGEDGDRRQEIVFIGTKLNEEGITAALDECLCTDDELAEYRAVWSAEQDRIDVEHGPFRFAVGDAVECAMGAGMWQRGKVVAQCDRTAKAVDLAAAQLATYNPRSLRRPAACAWHASALQGKAKLRLPRPHGAAVEPLHWRRFTRWLRCVTTLQVLPRAAVAARALDALPGRARRSRGRADLGPRRSRRVHPGGVSFETRGSVSAHATRAGVTWPLLLPPFGRSVPICPLS